MDSQQRVRRRQALRRTVANRARVRDDKHPTKPSNATSNCWTKHSTCSSKMASNARPSRVSPLPSAWQNAPSTCVTATRSDCSKRHCSEPSRNGSYRWSDCGEKSDDVEGRYSNRADAGREHPEPRRRASDAHHQRGIRTNAGDRAFTYKQGTAPTIAYLTDLIRRRIRPARQRGAGSSGSGRRISVFRRRRAGQHDSVGHRSRSGRDRQTHSLLRGLVPSRLAAAVRRKGRRHRHMHTRHAGSQTESPLRRRAMLLRTMQTN